MSDLLTEQPQTISATSDASLGVGLVFSVVAALWSASKGMKSLIEAVNVAFDERETRKFVRLRGLALLLTLGAVVMAAVSLGLIAVLPELLDELGTVGRGAGNVARWPLLAAGMILGLAVLYRYAPDRESPRWRWVSPGALVATLLWLLGSGLFAVYVDNFGKFNETYGTLGAVVVLLLWLNLTAFIVVLGAEMNAEAERQTAEDTTTGAERPLGSREAYAADTIGEAAA